MALDDNFLSWFTLKLGNKTVATSGDGDDEAVVVLLLAEDLS